MAKEIERKYLVDFPGLEKTLTLQSGENIVQGYICLDSFTAVRVRLRSNKATLTIKGPPSGFTRAEYEYQIPIVDAQEMLKTLAGTRVVEKCRYKVPYKSHLWEIDLFGGLNAPLVVAEVELKSEEEDINLPSWIGREVTHDERYTNASLSISPYSSWNNI